MARESAANSDARSGPEHQRQMPDYPAFRASEGLLPGETVIIINRRMQDVLLNLAESRANEADLVGSREPRQRRLATTLKAFVRKLKDLRETAPAV